MAYKRKIVHSKCKEPVRFDSCGYWECEKCGIVKKYNLNDDELKVREYDE